MTLSASTQNGMKQQPNQQPIKTKPPQESQVRRPDSLHARVTIVAPHRGQVHCIGYSENTIGAAYCTGCCTVGFFSPILQWNTTQIKRI